MKLGPIECSCRECRSMCERCPCIPTPNQARELVRLHPERMAVYADATGVRYVAPAAKDREAQQRNNGGGECTFYADGLCELHGTPLKPAQGQLAHHDRPGASLRGFILNLWDHADVRDLI